VSRRNPLNKRYQKESLPKGKTKKSAASAKPARKQGTGRATSATKDAKTADRKKQPNRVFPDTPEYKEARRKWWIAVGVAAAVLAVSFALTLDQVAEAIPFDEATRYFISSALVWSTAGLVGFSWWIDITQIRPMVKAHQAGLTLEQYRAQEDAKSTKAKRRSLFKPRTHGHGADKADETDKVAEVVETDDADEVVETDDADEVVSKKEKRCSS
jgi:hypothetical protein